MHTTSIRNKGPSLNYAPVDGFEECEGLWGHVDGGHKGLCQGIISLAYGASYSPHSEPRVLLGLPETLTVAHLLISYIFYRGSTVYDFAKRLRSSYGQSFLPLLRPLLHTYPAFMILMLLYRALEVA